MLLDRDDDLARADALLAAARAGRGALLVVEAPAGMGKTAFLAAVRERAAATGMQVLRARCGELEQAFAFGAVRQVLSPTVATCDQACLDRLGAGVARHALPLLREAETPGDELEDQRLLHSLHWFVANVTDDAPLLLCVDDAHWADPSSLRFLAYLVRRAEELPLLLALGTRPDAPPRTRELLDLLCDEPLAEVLHLAPLGPDAVAALTTDVFGGAPDAEFVAAATDVTAGVPFYVGELLRAARAAGLAPQAEDAAALAGLGPEGVARSVLRRVDALGEDAAALARALAVLGGPAPAPLLATITGRPPAAVLDAAAGLADAGILAGAAEPLDLAHAIVRQAITARLDPSTNGALHLRAAAALSAAGADAERVGAHLAHVPPGSGHGADVCALLLDAGRAALLRGAPEAAIGHLQRALLDEPAGELRAATLLTLARAELRAHRPGAVDRFLAGLDATPDPGRRAVHAAELVHLLPAAGRYEEAVAVARSALLDDGVPPGIAVELEAELLECAVVDARLTPGSRARLDELAAAARAGEELHPMLGAVVGHELVISGRDTALGVALATAALGHPALLAAGQTGAISAAGHGLIVAGHGDRVRPLLDHALEQAADEGSRLLTIWGSGMRAMAHLAAGDAARAESDARTALRLLAGDEAPGALGWLLGPAAVALAERGRAQEVLDLLDRHGVAEPLPPYLPLALVRLGRGMARGLLGDLEGAVDDLRAAGALHDPDLTPAFLPWRSAAARCLLALGRRGEAIALAEEEHALALRCDVPVATGRALATAGLCRGGREGVERLRAAVEQLREAGSELELARAQVDLGGALRRDNERTAARACLREGVDRASRCGAAVVVAQGAGELRAAGARPRRERLGGPEALTAAERRVVELAAAGATNREIAQALFLTQKTVETHLSSAYRKLDITSRHQLRDALAAA